MSAELDPDVIAPVTTNNSSTHSQRTESLIDTSLLEPEIPSSQIISSKSFSVSLAKNGLLNSLLNRVSHDFAGLSSDCRYCFFHGQNEISVYPLADLGVCGTRPLLSRALYLDKRATHGEPIVDAKMSLNFLITVTTKRVLIINISNKQEFEPILHRNWEPAGLAMHESESESLLVLILGYGKGNSLETTDGRIEIYKYRIGSRSRKLSYHSSPTLPTRARPKRLSLKEDGRILTCTTAIQSKLLVWELDQDFSSSAEPLAFTKNKYRQVSAHHLISTYLILTAPIRSNMRLGLPRLRCTLPLLIAHTYCARPRPPLSGTKTRANGPSSFLFPNLGHQTYLGFGLPAVTTSIISSSLKTTTP